MSVKNICKVFMVAAFITTIVGCSKTEGTMVDPSELGHKECTKSIECGNKSYCDEENGICMSECHLKKDCFFLDEAAVQAWQEQKAQGIAYEDMELPESSYKCSDCGTCIPVDQEDDDRCPKVSVILCDKDKDCESQLGEDYACGIDGYCSLLCDKDEECSLYGRGHVCSDDTGNERKVCSKYCYDDSSCAFHGFAWRCKLPDGVDQTENFWSDNSVLGRCIPEGTIDWGEDVDTEADTSKFVGVFGAVNETTFTNCGFPLVNCQDTTNIHHLLFRIRQTENGIELDGKYCFHEALNFKPDEDNPTMDIITGEEELAWMVVPEKYTLALPYHHWTAEPASFGVGDSFMTSHYLEIRGAKLDDPANDPLPTKDNLENAWDQDRDGNPGLTTIMNGMISGEIYNVNRADQYGDFEIVQVDENGRVMKFQGLLYTENESGILGATNPLYEVDIEPFFYKDPNRSYMRFMRLKETATCLDVIELGKGDSNCDPYYNNIVIDVEDDSSYLCHTPTINGPEPLDETGE